MLHVSSNHKTEILQVIENECIVEVSRETWHHNHETFKLFYNTTILTKFIALFQEKKKTRHFLEMEYFNDK